MRGLDVDNRRVKTVMEMALQFHAEVLMDMPGWEAALLEDPSRLESLEREVHQAFDRGADLIVAGMMAVVMKDESFEEQCEQMRQDYRQPVARGRERKLGLRLLGGLIVWITSLYCSPRRSSSSDRKFSGLYSELAQFGCGKCESPGLQSRVARKAALCPSFAFAQQELAREGASLDAKAVRRITYQCGDDLLRLRRTQIAQWRAGELPAGEEFVGKRVTVQLDGGRTRIRGEMRNAWYSPEKTDENGLVVEDAPGRSTKESKRSFDAEWREPKMMTIFVHDEKGRMAQQSRVVLDGTFLGPDAIAEIIAMHLHRLGAAKAKSVTFVADGAPWIWDRIPAIVAQVAIDSSRVHEVLDNYHASHHISLALKIYGLSEEARMPLYRQHRSLLRNGQWRRVVAELRGLIEGQVGCEKVETEIRYLEKHGEAGRLSYPTFRKQGLPLGSGAIESGIRRVINLRIKGNAIYWKQNHAESILQVRCYVLADRWDERLIEMRKHRATDGTREWAWEPLKMSSKHEANQATSV